MKLLLKIVLWVLALIALMVIVLFAINWRDETLKPEVAMAIDWEPPKVAFQDNGYLTLVGIDSPSGKDATAVGLELVQAELMRYEDTKNILEEPLLKRADARPFIDWKELRCDYTQSPNCLEFYQQQGEAKLTFLLASQDRLLARYQTIKQSQRWIEVVPPMVSAYAPSYTELMNAAELSRIQAIVLIRQQQTKQGFELLSANASLARRILNHSSTLISYMVALNMLQRDARIVSELMAQNPSLAKQYEPTIQAILAPIPNTISGLRHAFVHERAMQVGLPRALKKELNDALKQQSSSWSTFMSARFYQPNATANLFYELATLPIKMLEAKPNELDDMAKQMSAKKQDLLGVGIEPYYIKNPIGKVLASISTINYQNYIERHYDTEGHLTLIRLQHEVTLADAPEKAVNQLLPRFTDPYTQRPLQFDENTKQLSFKARQPSSVNLNKGQIYQITLPVAKVN